jgi:Uri superfamily endonuclease
VEVLTGSYVLLIELSEARSIEVGALGEIEFAAGAYAYVGSALSGLDARIDRHLRDDKRLHWHIDYLLQHADVVDVARVESDERLECRIAARLAQRLKLVERFGCSDCDCAGHLFHATSSGKLAQAVTTAVEEVR